MAGILAIENIDNELDVSDVDAAETAVAVADESAEVQSQGEEIGTSVAQIEDAVQAGEELEEIGEEVQESVESGEGLDEKSAELASLAIESIRNRLGVRGEPRLVPVAESFGSTSSRLASTKLIVEGITDTLKRVWTAIKQTAARVWDKIVSFIANLFNSTKLLGKHIASLKERARKIPSSATPKEKKIKHAGIARAIAVGGQATLTTYETIVENTQKLASVALKSSAATEVVVDAAKALAKQDITAANVKAYLNSNASAAKAAEALFVASFTVASHELQAAPKNSPKKQGANTHTQAFGPFVNSTVLVLSVRQHTVLGTTTSDFSIAFEAAKGKIAESVTALTASEVQTVLKIAGDLTNSLADFNSIKSNIEKIKKASDGVADAVISNVQKILGKTGSDSETREGLAQLKSTVSDSIAVMNAYGNRAPSLIYAAAKAGADYASVSLANLKEK